MSATYALSYRISRAVWAAAMNTALWILLPLLLSDVLRSFVPSAPVAIGSPFILSFGIPITALQTVGALAVGMAASVPILSGSYLAEAYYIWTAADGGALSLTVQGTTFALLFQPLLFLLMLPSLFGSVSVPLNFLLEQSEAGREATDEV